MKRLVPAYILCFVTSFMIFFNEPLMMYFTNLNDFWFDFEVLLLPTFVLFLGIFLALALAATLCYLVATKFFKKPKLFNAVHLMAFALFIVTYIQGNYLVGNLPPLDGTTIDWATCLPDMFVSVFLLGLVVLAVVLAVKKFHSEPVIKYSTYISVAIFAMLSLPTITTVLTKDVFLDKDQVYITDANLSHISSDHNFLILLLDAVDSNDFHALIEQNPAYKSVFTDFTYYPDTVSAYTFSRDSIPFILSGKWNENHEEFLRYYGHAMEESSLLSVLTAADYDINLYEDELPIYDERIQNAKSGITNYSRKCFIKQEGKYTLFRYLPYYLKSLSKIDTLDFSECRGQTIAADNDAFKWYMPDFYQVTETTPLEKQERKYFQFVHLEGAHVPFNLDKDMNALPEEGTYTQKIEASITMARSYLTRLRQAGAYDNSTIIIMADHGFSFVDHTFRENPILLIKGVDEHHPLEISSAAVSYTDLVDSYPQLINGAKSSELFQGLDPTRPRRFLHNLYKSENHMQEYEQRGPAWDKTTIQATGQEFSR